MQIYSYDKLWFYCKFFPIGFVATVMFEFDVEVKRDIRAINFIAFFVGAGEVLFDFDSKPSIFLSVFELIKFQILVLNALK